MTPALVIIILVVAAILTFALQRLHERNRIRGRRVAMESLWASWNALGPLTTEERFEREALLAQVDGENRESVHQSLLDFEAKLQSEVEPMITLRKELMDSVDRRLLNMEILQLPEEVKNRLRAQSSEMMQTDQLARAYIAANDLRMAVLRKYAERRFDDCVKGDWFDVYQKASRLKQKGARNFIQRTLSGSQSSVDDARYQTMTIVDHEIRARLLKMPAGARFPGFNPEPDAKPGD
jgi:hypothetical protein